MNHKERVHAVLNGEQPDRLPVSTWGHDFLREWSAADLAAHTIERQQTYDYDFVKLNPRWTMFAEPWGNNYAPPSEQKFPRLTHKIVSQPEDLRDIPQVTAGHPVFKEHVEALKLVLDGMKGDVDVIATIFSPLAITGLLCGGVGEPLRSFAQQEGEALHEALGHISDTLTDHVHDLLQTGASGIFFAPLQWTSLDVCDDPFFNEFGRPYDFKVLNAASDAPFNMMHVCGNNIGLQRFFDYPAQVFNWDNFGPGNLSLAEASALTDKVVAGGIPHTKLHRLTGPELTQVTSNAIEGAGPNLMLAGGCGVGALVNDEIRCAVAQVPAKLQRPNGAG